MKSSAGACFSLDQLSRQEGHRHLFPQERRGGRARVRCKMRSCCSDSRISRSFSCSDLASKPRRSSSMEKRCANIVKTMRFPSHKIVLRRYPSEHVQEGRSEEAQQEKG